MMAHHEDCRCPQCEQPPRPARAGGKPGGAHHPACDCREAHVARVVAAAWNMVTDVEQKWWSSMKDHARILKAALIGLRE